MEGVLFDYEAFWDLNFQVDWRVSWLRLLDSVRPVSTFKPSLVVAVDAFPEEEPSSLWTALAARVRAQKVDWPSASGEGDTAEDLDEDGGASPSVSDEEVVDDISDGEEVELALDSDASQDLRLVVSHSRPTPSPRMGWSNFQFVGVSCRKCVREHLRICSSSIMPRPSPVWGGGSAPPEEARQRTPDRYIAGCPSAAPYRGRLKHARACWSVVPQESRGRGIVVAPAVGEHNVCACADLKACVFWSEVVGHM